MASDFIFASRSLVKTLYCNVSIIDPCGETPLKTCPANDDSTFTAFIVFCQLDFTCLICAFLILHTAHF